MSKLSSPTEGNIFFRQIYVILTHKCPLNCDYCYIDKDSKYPDMTWENMKHIMEVVRPQFKGGRGIVFFGGEPMLRFDLIEKTVKTYSESIPGGIGGLVTSASVGMDKLFPLYRDYPIDLQISYDGLAHSMSRHRKFDFGVLQQYFDYPDRRFQLRKTVSESNIDTLIDDYKVGRDINTKYNVSFDFAVAHQKSYRKDFWDKFYLHLSEIWRFIGDTLKHEEPTYIPLTLMKDLFHLKKYIDPSSCMDRIDSCEIGHILVIDGNGDCFPCTMLSQLGEEFKIGNIYTKIDVDKTACYSTRMDCNCPYSRVCGGGCRWERFQNHGKQGMVGQKMSSTCKMLHIKYTCAQKFWEGLDDKSMDIVDHAVDSFWKYQKLTFDHGMYVQAKKTACGAVKNMDRSGLISWR